MEMETIYRTYKPLLFTVAYRMLGSVSDAEDMVQDLFYSLQASDTDHISNLKAYLVKMISNRSLNFLKSARKKREVYTGPWLPEPQFIVSGQDPMERIIQEEAVSYAFLVLLQQLTPIERVVFILRESFGYEYGELAGMLNKTEANCRKIHSRAKLKINFDAESRPDQITDTGLLVKSFLNAVNTGNFEQFVRLLTEDANLITDAGGKRSAALKPIFGRLRIQALFEGIAAKGSLHGEWLSFVINGQQGLVLVKEQNPVMVICFDMDGEGLQAGQMFVLMNPDKLRHISSALDCHKSPPDFVL